MKELFLLRCISKSTTRQTLPSFIFVVRSNCDSDYHEKYNSHQYRSCCQKPSFCHLPGCFKFLTLTCYLNCNCFHCHNSVLVLLAWEQIFNKKAATSPISKAPAQISYLFRSTFFPLALKLSFLVFTLWRFFRFF